MLVGQYHSPTVWYQLNTFYYPQVVVTLPSPDVVHISTSVDDLLQLPQTCRILMEQWALNCAIVGHEQPIRMSAVVNIIDIGLRNYDFQ